MQKIDFAQRQLPFYCAGLCSQTCITTAIQIEFVLSTLFTILTLVISTYHIVKHMYNFNNPFFQSKIVIILLMAPFYSVTSTGSFLYPQYEFYLTLFRNFYETIMLFAFFCLMFSYLAYDREKDTMEDKKVYVAMSQNEKQVPHSCPCSWFYKPYQLTDWRKAKYFTYRCKKFILQYFIIKVVTTLMMYIMYGNQQLNQITVHPTYDFISWLVDWIVAISSCYSIYYTELFYNALSKPLAPFSPLLKFLTINVIIFFTFWQTIVLGVIDTPVFKCFDKQAPSYNERKLSASLQNTLICFQMLIMSFASGLAWNYESYKLAKFNKRGSFTYVIQDTIKTFQNDFRLVKPKKFGFKEVQNTQIQLHEIKWQHRESAIAQKVLTRPLYEIMIRDYF